MDFSVAKSVLLDHYGDGLELCPRTSSDARIEKECAGRIAAKKLLELELVQLRSDGGINITLMGQAGGVKQRVTLRRQAQETNFGVYKSVIL